MVQPNFSTSKKDTGDGEGSSATAALDVFLDNQHQSYFEELYKSEAVCLCILRLLPPVHRHIVLHYLWSHQGVSAIDLKLLIQQPEDLSLELIQDVLKPLHDRKILGGMTYSQNKMRWSMNDSFKKGLRNALTGMGTSNSFGVPYQPDDDEDVPGVDELIEYGEETWESILKYMVSSGLANGLVTIRPRQQVLQLLYSSGLMADNADLSGERPNLERLTITSKGFQFLLEDRQTQVWEILMYYLTLRENREHNTAPILSLFFSLGTMQLGHAYSASASFASQAQQAVLSDLEQYGFILRRQKSSDDGSRADAFYPTHLATSLCSGDLAGQLGGAEGEEKRFLILETNYKIYAYTSNELEIAILNLFVDIRIRYPNLVVGKLDRKHVKAAMEKGISAAQIIAYLGSHAHSQMYLSPPPILHPTIVDQLHLWDKERNRLKADDAEMFEFFSKELYDDTETEAKRYDGLLLAVPSAKLLFVDPAIKEPLRDYVKGQQRQLRGE